MSLLERHLEQITLSAESIATLPFPPPKIFTNALLSNHDITSLIRDTEPHERALFSVPPPPAPSLQPDPASSSSRRQTVFAVSSGEVVTASANGRAPRRNTAVAAVLGAELHSQVRKTETGRGEVDIEVLLRGAEKLNSVYPVEGVPERIRMLRRKWEALRGSVRVNEERVERMTRELERFNRGEEEEEEDMDMDIGGEEEGEGEEEIMITDEDLRREEEEIRALERKKKELEERVSGMERDLGGLLRS
ncbi:DASH complex subunit Spc34 protein [Rutstroemia sp. NJR-2017a BBW]|nr:DASH complex subunit Spc34 protein [Rutstroemia sp. NJR-2017a BBW]